MTAELHPEDLAWVAGLLEGEGSFLLRKGNQRPTPRIMCQMTDLDVLEKLRDLAGGKVSPMKNPRPGEYKDSWRWSLYGRERVVSLAEQLLPHM